MSGRYVHIPECKTLLWFPDDPKFGQWLSKKSLADYGLDYRHPDHQTIVGLEYDTVLVNWSPTNSIMAFQVLQSDLPATQFYDSEAFKYMRDTMDGVVMKGGFMMIEKPMDVVLFRMLYAG